MTKKREPVETVRERTVRRRARLDDVDLKMRSLYVEESTWTALHRQATAKGLTLSAHVRAILGAAAAE